jgi:hypothetical protein
MLFNKRFFYQGFVRPNIYPDFIVKGNQSIDEIIVDPINPLRVEMGEIGPDPAKPYHLKTNRDGYRSDEFKRKHSGKHIVFAGCSETYGQGDELEYAWAHRLYSLIKEEEEVCGFYNLGKCGAGFQDIINIVFDYIKQFSKPDALFIMFPNVNRFTSYLMFEDFPEANGFYPVSHMAGKATIPTSGTFVDLSGDKRFEFEGFQDIYAHFILYIKVLDELCKMSGIDFYWSTWDKDGLTGSRFENNRSYSRGYVSNGVTEEKLYEEIKKNKKLNLVKEDMHKGTAHHKIWADSFFQAYKKNEKK